MDSLDAYGYSPSMHHQQQQPSSYLPAAQHTTSDRDRQSDDGLAVQKATEVSLSNASQLSVNSRSPLTLPATKITGRVSPAMSNFGFGESQALAIPGSSTNRRNQLSSPSFSTTSASPSLSAASAPFHFAAASTSQNTSTGNSRFNLASTSHQSLHSLGNTTSNIPSGKGSVKDSQTGSGSSDHSRHSSGYASSIGGGGGGGGGLAGGAFADYGGSTLYGSTSSYGAGASGASLGVDGPKFTNGRASISVGSLASALARSSVNDHAAIQMTATSSYGSSAAGSAQSYAGPEAGSALPRPVFLRQSFSDGSPKIVDPGSPAASQKSASSSTNPPVQSSLTSTVPLSTSDPRTQLGITNLPYRVRWQDLKDLFRKAGTVLRADVSLTPDNRSRGYGTVLMASEDDAVRACDMFRGFNWQGRTLDVLIDRSGTFLGPALAASNGSGSSAASMSFSSSLSPTPSSFNGAAGRPIAPLPAPQQLLQPQQVGQQLPTGISPALYPFLGASNRASIAAPSSHLQAGSPSWTGTGVAGQQRSSSFSAGVPQPSSNSTTQPGNTNATAQTLQQQHPFSQGQGILFQSINGPQYQQLQQLQQPTFTSPFAPNAGIPLQYRSSSMPMQQQLAGQPMMNPYMSMNPAATMFLPASLPQAPQANSYFGRVLFVGNLPFHCQWQDLKDLFRSAGNIQRADVALSAEGKSRGFGTVLFASAEDAQNAVRIYHGYEYSGRTLKVHFDRFAQTTIPLPGTLPATAAQYTLAFAAANTPSNVSSSSAAQTQHHQQHQDQQQQRQQQQQQQLPQQQSNLLQQQVQQHQSAPGKYPPASNSGYDNSNGVSSFSTLGNGFGLGVAGSSQSSAADPSTTQPPVSMQGGTTAEAHTEAAKSTSARPGRISLPPQGFSGMMQPSQNMSHYYPPSSRMSVPMTPGMPGFTFHAIPQTPPAYHHFLSPGLNGPFSPPLGSPLMGPATPGASSGAFNPHLNHAPGAPIHFSNGMTTPISNVLAGLPSGFNPMFPPMGISYAPAQHQPIQQQYGLPQTPHWSQPHQQQRRRKEKEPLPDEDEQSKEENSTALHGEEAAAKETTTLLSQNAAPKDDEGGYPFPLVNPALSALSQRRASTNSPAISPMQFDSKVSAVPKSPGWERRGSLALNMSSLSIVDPASSSKLGIRRMLASSNEGGEGDEIPRQTAKGRLGSAFGEEEEKESIQNRDGKAGPSRGGS